LNERVDDTKQPYLKSKFTVPKSHKQTKNTLTKNSPTYQNKTHNNFYTSKTQRPVIKATVKALDYQ